MNNIIIGIDPGATGGAVAIIGDDFKHIRSFKVPLVERQVKKTLIKYEVAAIELLNIYEQVLRSYKTASVKCYIEKPFAIAFNDRKDNTKPVFIAGLCSLFQSYGALKTVAEIIGIDTISVSVQTWKSKYKLKSDKNQSLSIARQIFPAVNLMHKKDHNIAEALLIAGYGLQQQRQKNELKD